MTLVRDFLESWVPGYQDATFVLGVSGGVDSMVLLHQFVQLFGDASKDHLVVVHVNHQLRPESDEEEALVVRTCQDAGVLCETYHWENREGMTAMESRARNFRQACYREVLMQYDAQYLVLAHHGDDQVETILMKWTRGTSAEGLAGMKSVRPFSEGTFLIRPFLGVSKDTLYQLSQEASIPYLEDASNQSLVYTRNRYRHGIVPLLKQENPQVVAHFQEMSQLLLDSQTVLAPLLEETFGQVFHQTEEGWRWCRGEWLSQSEAMQRLLLGQLSQRVQPPISSKQLVQIQRSIHSKRPQLELHLAGGWYFYRSYDELTLSSHRQVPRLSERVHTMTSTQGSVQLSKREYLTTEPDASAFSMVVSVEDFPITIRHRRPGDNLLINAQGQHQSIQRWCVNQKIPQAQREQLWLVENAHQEIIAILGYRQPLSLSKRKETGTIVLFYKT